MTEDTLSPLLNTLKEGRSYLISLKESLYMIASAMREQTTVVDLERARQKAENDPEALNDYRIALENAFGISISSDIPLDYAVLWEYHQALDRMATFLETGYFDEELLVFVNRHEFFQATMGNMIFQYEVFDPENQEHRERLVPPLLVGQACEENIVYTVPRFITSGHLIIVHPADTPWKYQCVGGKLQPLSVEIGQATSNNIIHELAHALNAFSGFGVPEGVGSLIAALNLNNETIATRVQGILEDCDREASSDQYHLPREIQADVILALESCPEARAKLKQEFPDIEIFITSAIQNAITHHAPVEAYAQAFGWEYDLNNEISYMSPHTNQVTTLNQVNTSMSVFDPRCGEEQFRNENTSDCITNLRLGPSINSATGQGIVRDTSRDIQIIGINQEETWFYVGITSDNGARYGWIERRTLEARTGINLPDMSSLPIIDSFGNPLPVYANPQYQWDSSVSFNYSNGG